MIGGNGSIGAARDRLVGWLTGTAMPLWASAGFDARGVAHEALDADGAAPGGPSRARVQCRQAWVLTVAPTLGWRGDGVAMAARTLDAFVARHGRGDGLYLTLVAPGGSILDDRALAYDQAFFLLATAHLFAVTGEGRWRALALETRAALDGDLALAGGGYAEAADGRPGLFANPNMHLLEAALAWAEATPGEGWGKMADGIARAALGRLIRADTGALVEAADAATAPEATLVEPGHQFEWAWLLRRWAGEGAETVARRLTDIGENAGVDPGRGVAIGGLDLRLGVVDPVARLWPQTERIKAHLAMAAPTGRADPWRAAQAAVAGLEAYLDKPAPGLWRDRMRADGILVEEPAPASSLYHIVGAIAELDRVVRASITPRPGTSALRRGSSGRPRR